MPWARKRRESKDSPVSPATSSPSWEGVGGWVKEGARLGTKKVRIERFSRGVPRQAPLPGKGPGDGSRKAPAWAQKK